MDHRARTTFLGLSVEKIHISKDCAAGIPQVAHFIILVDVGLRCFVDKSISVEFASSLEDFSLLQGIPTCSLEVQVVMEFI